MIHNLQALCCQQCKLLSKLTVITVSNHDAYTFIGYYAFLLTNKCYQEVDAGFGKLSEAIHDTRSRQVAMYNANFSLKCITHKIQVFP